MIEEFISLKRPAHGGRRAAAAIADRHLTGGRRFPWREQVVYGSATVITRYTCPSGLAEISTV